MTFQTPLDHGSAAGLRGTLLRLRAHKGFILVVLVMITLAVICLKDAIGWIGKPFPGFLYYEFPVVGSYGHYEWPGTRAGIRYRDVVISVNDRKVSSGRDIEKIISRIPVGETVRYLLDRRGEKLTLEIPVVRFGLQDFLQVFLPSFIVALIFWLLAVIVYLLKPNTPTTWSFLLLCLFIGTYAGTGFQVQSRPDQSWYYVNTIIGMTLFPAPGLHLALLFPERTTWIQRWPRIQVVPYVAFLLLAAYQALDVVAFARPGLGPEEILAISSHMLRALQLTRFCTLLVAIAFVSLVAHTYFRSASAIAKQRARIVLLGSGVAFVIPTAAMGVAALTTLLVPFNLLPFPAVAFPAAIGYAVARHNLFDVDVYVKRAVGYGIMTGIVGATYFGLQTLMSPRVLGSLFGEASEAAYPFIFALFVVLLFNPVSRKVQESVDRIFFRKKLDYKQTISAVSDALTSMLNLDQIIKQVVHTVRKEMFIDAAGVILLESQKKACQTFFVADEGRDAPSDFREVSIGYDDPLLALTREEKKLVTKYDIEEDPRYSDIKDSCLRSFSTMAASLAVPLLYQGQVTGVLAVGYRKSGQLYTREDIDLLATMANQAAVAIQNATTHEEVVRYAEELAASLRRIQTLESIKSNLAKFVPKTVQDLIEESPEAPSLDKREADLSVVFADITGYTRLSAQMELDQVNRLVERYFGAFLDEIVKYGGDVNETVGDGLMVIFRDPDPQRHARAAVLAALGIQRRTAQINTQLQGQFEPIAMHVGVNSGIASVGATKIEGATGTRWTYTASGPTTNVAARLAALGEGGAVVLSEETRQRLGDEFEAEDLGPQSLKNVAQAVRVYRIKTREEEPVAAGALAERRRHPRQTVSWPVRLWIGEEKFDGRAVDASVYGICLASVPMALLEVGKSYRVEILTGGDGEAAWVAEVRNLSDRGVGMGTREPLPVPEDTK